MALGIHGFNRMKSGGGSVPFFEQDFSYTGAMQSVTVPVKGLYKLETWGGEGGMAIWVSSGVAGIKGSYSVGYVVLNKGTTLYVGVGGAGGSSNPFQSAGAGGYNGGGAGAIYLLNGYNFNSAGGGGGATHFSFENAIISGTSDVNNILIVAGGGAGGGARRSNGTDYTEASNTAESSNNVKGSGTAGTGYNGAGGGGYYGGPLRYCGMSNLDNVPSITYKGITYSPSTTINTQASNGKAKITLVA